MPSEVTVHLKPRAFATFKVAGVAIELFTEALHADGVAIVIKSPKKIAELRTFQELPGLAPATPAIAGQAGDDKPRARTA